jgi:hypothetical protein
LRKDIDEFAKLQDSDKRRNPEFARIKGNISRFSDFLDESLPNMSPDDPFSSGYRDIINSWNTKGTKEGVIEKCRQLVEKDPGFKDQKDEFKKICENAKKSMYRSVASEDKMY